MSLIYNDKMFEFENKKHNFKFSCIFCMYNTNKKMSKKQKKTGNSDTKNGKIVQGGWGESGCI